jgi:hypothetical protein
MKVGQSECAQHADVSYLLRRSQMFSPDANGSPLAKLRLVLLLAVGYRCVHARRTPRCVT